LKTLTAQWSWYRRSCGYCSSILDFLELYLRRDLEHNVLAPQPAVPESRGWKSSSHSRDGITTILLSKFAKNWCTMLGDEYFSRMYHDEFLAWCAQREGNGEFAGGFICIIRLTPPPNLDHFWVIFQGWSQILPSTKLLRHEYQSCSTMCAFLRASCVAAKYKIKMK